MYITCPLCNARHELTDESPSSGVKQDVCDQCGANLIFVEGTLRRPSRSAKRTATRLENTSRSKVAGIIALVVLCVINYALLGASVLAVERSIKSSKSYQMSEAFIRSNDQIKRAIGDEMEFEFLPTARMNTGAKRSTAEFSIDVTGPLGSTVVDLRLLKKQLQWQIVEAQYVDATGQAQVLVAEETPSPGTVLVAKAPQEDWGASQQAAVALTEQRIKNLLEAVDRAANERDADGIIAHMAEDVVIDVSLQLPQEQQKFLLTREQYKSNLQQGYAAAEDYGFLRRVTKIEFAQGGQRAMVQSQTLESVSRSGSTAQIEAEETATWELRGGKPVITKVQAVARMAAL